MTTDLQTDEQRRQQRAADIQQFAERHFAGPHQDLLSDALLTLCRLARDPTNRGDMKLIETALAELRYALKVFAPYRNIRKVSIFGSARVSETHPDYVQAYRFAEKISEHGWMVITGAGDGIMKAGHDGAGVAQSFGVAIQLPFEQKTNEIIAEDNKLVNFRYFFTRKLMFMKEASALALFPGGFGTQDESFEALTLIQTGKAPLIPIVMCEQPGGTYWPQWRAYVAAELLRTGMISDQDMHLFRITDDVDAAVREVVNFYRVYHSMRYVGPDLILRLHRAVSPATLERLNDEYARILSAGRFEQCAARPAERGEHAELPRLKFRFDRKSLGLLRRALDLINQEPEPPAAS